MMNQEEKLAMGKRIKQERERKGLSQEELAERLEMKRTNVANYEAGRVIPPGNVLKELAKILDVDSDYILGLSKEKKKSNDTHNELRDIKEFLEKASDMEFDGVPVSNEAKQRILGYLEAMFWDAKNKNNND